MRLRGRVDLDFVTKPSLSSLKLLIASVILVVFVVERFTTLGCFATALGGAAVATRAVADVILVRFGRGIVKTIYCELLGFRRVARRQASAVLRRMVRWCVRACSRMDMVTRRDVVSALASTRISLA